MDSIFIQGHRWTTAQAKIPFLNSGLLFGEILFESIPVYLGTALFLEDHLDRLKQGCAFLNWPLTPLPWLHQAIQWFSRFQPCFLLRITMVQPLKKNASPRFFSTTPPWVIASCRPLLHHPFQFNPIQGEAGISAWHAISPQAMPTHFKLPWYLTARHSFQKNPQWSETLKINAQGHVVDGAWACPCWAHHHRIYVPPQALGRLPSITLSKMITLGRSLGILIQEKPWSIRDIQAKDELFFVGSGVGVLSIQKLQTHLPLAPPRFALRLWQLYRHHIFTTCLA
jgi:branched-subunit amino acid aminotransferase/4-amino-4-deoxychorismate lyase